MRSGCFIVLRRKREDSMHKGRMGSNWPALELGTIYRAPTKRSGDSSARRRLLKPNRERPFRERERGTIAADDVDFAFNAGQIVIAGKHDIAVAAQIPVGIGFAADAAAPCEVFRGSRGSGVGLIGRTLAQRDLYGRQSRRTQG